MWPNSTFRPECDEVELFFIEEYAVMCKVGRDTVWNNTTFSCNCCKMVLWSIKLWMPSTNAWNTFFLLSKKPLPVLDCDLHSLYCRALHSCTILNRLSFDGFYESIWGALFIYHPENRILIFGFGISTHSVCRYSAFNLSLHGNSVFLQCLIAGYLLTSC